MSSITLEKLKEMSKMLDKASVPPQLPRYLHPVQYDVLEAEGYDMTQFERLGELQNDQ